jgi:uncharacterized linocin/CFP29 family protein
MEAEQLLRAEVPYPDWGPPSGTVSPLEWGIQNAVNEVAEAALVARRLLDTVQTDELVPVELKVSREAKSSAYKASAEAGVLFHAEFAVDLAAASMAQAGSRGASLSELAGAVRGLVAQEDAKALADLAGVPASQTTVAGRSDHEALLTTATALRARGHTGPLAVVMSGTLYAQLLKNKLLRHLEALFPEGLLAAAMPAGVDAIVLEPSAGNMHILVGQNYAVSWVQCDGVQHRFAVCVSLKTVIAVPEAIQVLRVRPATPARKVGRAKPRPAAAT